MGCDTLQSKNSFSFNRRCNYLARTLRTLAVESNGLGHKVVMAAILDSHLGSLREELIIWRGSLCTDLPPPSGKIGRGDVCESPSLIEFRYKFA